MAGKLRTALTVSVALCAVTLPAIAQDAPPTPEKSAIVPDATTVTVMGKKLRRDRRSVRVGTQSASSCGFVRGFSPNDETLVQDYLDGLYGDYNTAGDAGPETDETDPLRPGGRVRDTSPFGNAAQDRNNSTGSAGDRFITASPGGCTTADVGFAAGRNEILRRDKSLTQAFDAFDSGDYTKALPLFEAAYNKIGYDQAAFMAAKMYLSGLGTPRDTIRAIGWLKKVAEAKFDPKDRERFDPSDPHAMSLRADATMTLAKIYLTGWDVPRDIKTATKLYEKADSIGYIPATHILGQFYQNGFDGETSLSKAITHFKRAGTAGYTPSQYALGLIYYNGEGVPEDRKLAGQWLMAAASGGHPDALFAVGRMYDLGDTLPQDSQKALVYYNDAALKGQAEAQTALGTYFYTGEIVAKDHAIARKWFEMAANAGDADAMFNLAVMLTKGEGGDRNPMLAYAWFRLAELTGHDNAGAAADQLSLKLTEAERTAAEALIKP